VDWGGGRFCPQNWFVTAIRKTNFRAFIYSLSIIPANWVKIGLVDVQIKGLTELLKRKQEKNEHFISLLYFRCASRSRVG